MENKVIQFSPGDTLVPSKRNAKEFHLAMKERIMESGNVWDYVAFLKFAAKLNNVLFGDYNGRTNEEKVGDKELQEYIKSEIAKYPGGKFTSQNGVVFQNAEVGQRYDFSHTQAWVELDTQEREIREKKKALEEMLKKIPPGKSVFDGETGLELVGPAKTSKSSFKVTLPNK
jgi:hypothetical protein